MSTDAAAQTSWSIKRLLEWTAQHFTTAQVDSPRLCAEIILAHVLKCQRIDLYVKYDYLPTAQELTEFRELVRRAADHEPVAYLIGKKQFFSLDFHLTPAVLIPRPESELLVSEAIDFLCRQTSRPTAMVLDLCTGSGCLAIAVAANVMEAQVLAVDNSEAALAVARSNVESHHLTSRVELLQSDLYDQITNRPQGSIFDLIISNPPYISAAEYQLLPPSVRDHEPRSALFGGEDGLDYYRRIARDSDKYLADNGCLMAEVAYNQAGEVIALFEQSGYLKDIKAVKDGLGHQRVIAARKD